MRAEISFVDTVLYMGLFPTCSLNHKKTSTGASLRLELNITLLTRTKSVQNIATIIPCIKKVQCSLSSGWAMHGVENRSFQNYVLLQQKQAVFQNLVSCLARQHFSASYGHWTFACQFHKYCHSRDLRHRPSAVRVKLVFNMIIL